jgi:predicted  nucleic acid-binding Zn-ribbon protein
MTVRTASDLIAREDANQVFNDIGREYTALERKRDSAREKKDEAADQAARGEAEAEIADLETRLKGVIKQFKSLEKVSCQLVTLWP